VIGVTTSLTLTFFARIDGMPPGFFWAGDYMMMIAFVTLGRHLFKPAPVNAVFTLV